MKEMEDLIRTTSPADLEKIKIDILKSSSIPKDSSIICKTEQEFMMKLSERITGVTNKRAYVLQHWSSVSEVVINNHREESTKQKRLFVLPSIVEFDSMYNPEKYFEPYLAFFTHDKKVFVYPRDEEFFSDSDFLED